jgi:phosphomannomutase
LSLLKTVSGIRGTIGGRAGENLTPIDIVECTAGFGQLVLQNTKNPKIVIGRDGRISGEMVNQLVVNTLRMMGIAVIDLGLSTTPTVEMAVPEENAGGGIIITASHNPKEWNALKFLNQHGEFISKQEGESLLQFIASGDISFATVEKIGSYTQNDTYIQKHISKILHLPLVKIEAIRAKKFKIVVDAINSTGAFAVPALLNHLDCQVIVINGEVNGRFAHNPEPLKDHLKGLEDAVKFHRAHLGIAVDPDVDRLVFMCEDGELFGEEYTLVAVADYVLKNTPGPTVSNLSSTSALRDITEKKGQYYEASAVGEVYVVEKMKQLKAVIGGEGNGGIIYPPLHYGRDALVGIALFLSYLAEANLPISFLRRRYPEYFMAKKKIPLPKEVSPKKILQSLQQRYLKYKLTDIDGLKIELDRTNWIHIRTSNTEPIMRIYTESTSEVIADNLADKIMSDVQDILSVMRSGSSS